MQSTAVEPDVTESAETVREVVVQIVEALVDYPEEVMVEIVRVADGEYILRVKVGSEDQGKVIGKQGRTANAIRSLARAAGMKYRLKVSVVMVHGDTGPLQR